MSAWGDMDWQERSETGRDAGGRSIWRSGDDDGKRGGVRVEWDGTRYVEAHRGQVIPCSRCGSPDVREVEVQRVTGMGPSVWRCVECGHEQTNETEHEALRRGQRP